MEAVIDPAGPTIVGQIPTGALRHGGAWADFLTIHIPDGLEGKPLKAELVDDVWVISLDVDTVTADQWTSVRAQQKQKLYESDWTCSVIDPPPEIMAARDAWLQYRAQLRDVTLQSDPFNIVWPQRPSP
jgi:hypothetical protein